MSGLGAENGGCLGERRQFFEVGACSRPGRDDRRALGQPFAFRRERMMPAAGFLDEAVAGKAMGLDPKWAYQAVSAVGNYGEIFERHLGKDSPLKIDRGLNRLWNDGGLMYAPPAR